MTSAPQSWLTWALLSAVFAALTAIFAKVGVEGVNSDLATLVRTIVIGAVLAALLAATGKLEGVGGFAPRTWTFLILSGLATGASWLCYFRAVNRRGILTLYRRPTLTPCTVRNFGLSR